MLQTSSQLLSSKSLLTAHERKCHKNHVRIPHTSFKRIKVANSKTKGKRKTV